MAAAGHHNRSITIRPEDLIVSPAATDRPASRVATAVTGAITNKSLATGPGPRLGSGQKDAETIAHTMKPKAPPSIHRPARPRS
jgi:hypothetical protein